MHCVPYYTNDFRLIRVFNDSDCYTYCIFLLIPQITKIK
uniref:Heat shock 70 kDa protein 14 n=1 Tax=Mesocestoides corti TaxID=53468 RepID=A0A5K3FDF9_MESCO